MLDRATGIVPMARPAVPEAPYLVAGLGRAGTAAVRALEGLVPAEKIWAWDADTTAAMHRTQRQLQLRGIRTWLGSPPGRIQVRWISTVIKSPGIGRDCRLLARARAAGLEIVDELELGWRLSDTRMVAITGTNGKSTVAGLTQAVLSAAGERVELAGNTLFGSPLSATERDLDWIVCEASSFQLESCPRLLPELAVFTNLTPDHLGRHHSMERYGECKRRLFVRDGEAASRAVVCVGDSFGADLALELEQRRSTVSRVGFGRDADYRIESTTGGLRGAVITLATPFGRTRIETALPGTYNAINLAAALAAADLLGVSRDHSVAAIESFPGVPGRFEHVDEGQPFDVIVDSGTNPDAVERFLDTVRAGMSADRRLVTVIGIGGRPGTAVEEVGRVARGRSDHLVLTTAGERGVPPLLCLGAALRGARRAPGGDLDMILDRRAAIASALRTASPGDVVAILGRGAFGHMLFDRRGKPVAFDDRVVVRELLEHDHAAARADRPQSVSDTPRLLRTARSSSSAL